jgi:hypothetical protein
MLLNVIFYTLTFCVISFIDKHANYKMWSTILCDTRVCDNLAQKRPYIATHNTLLTYQYHKVAIYFTKVRSLKIVLMIVFGMRKSPDGHGRAVGVK